MSVIQRLCLVPLAAVLILNACNRSPKEWKTPNMTPPTPRLQAMFEKTKAVCFGRFMVDVPASATVAWGEVAVPLGVNVYPNGTAEVKTLAQKFIDELMSDKAINQNDVPLLISVHEVNQPEGKIVVGYEDFEAINGLKINGYFTLNNDGVVIDSRPLRPRKDQVIADITSIARRLQQRAENEIPAEPGNCIEYAFLPDNPAPGEEPPVELIRIGFRLKEFPDTHLSVFVGPSNPHYEESHSLEWRLTQLEKNQKAQDPNNPLIKTKDLRRGERQIHGWLNGFEALSRTPEQAEIHSIHDFAMDFRGVPSDPLKPYVEIQMQTGVADNVAGATKASLTDEEAIAVWDKITSTIRVRPTGAAAVKTAETDSAPRLPLGELAATGRACPQTGWWVPDEPKDTQGDRRQHIKAGERMPHVISLGEPSIWQKLKGERPTYRTATMWKLVSYDDAPVHVDTIEETQTLVQGSPDNVAAKNASGNTTERSRNDQSSPQTKG
ncbi:T6SS immunity protein Tli4 family protein [Massilia sp. YIM B02769]|uniref:T6SS immunity protein Tli4 family protein n=1 Tax=Massilia sp. YIM B02769 TaxID=3050129 RepID=UPI0025B6B24B|nr:T6SS immunity protein Tli4 family protein [Massilia sp. YIM B02769]MDN4061381.1 T6SS immunity protein Tli4 family protein [Massilia sp. YIM B02769]